MKPIDDTYHVFKCEGWYRCHIGGWSWGPFRSHREARRFGRRQWWRAYRKLTRMDKLKLWIARLWAGESE